MMRILISYKRSVRVRTCMLTFTFMMNSWWEVINFAFLVLYNERRWFGICMEKAWLVICIDYFSRSNYWISIFFFKKHQFSLYFSIISGCNLMAWELKFLVTEYVESKAILLIKLLLADIKATITLDLINRLGSNFSRWFYKPFYLQTIKYSVIQVREHIQI